MEEQTQKQEKKQGRPTIYTQELADLLCSQLAEGKSLRTVCASDDMPDKATVFRWLRTLPTFCDQYTRAKEQGTEAWADEMLDIADKAPAVITGIDKSDSARVHAEQLRIDTRKWILAKLKPKKYGDKIDHTTNGKDLPTPILGYVPTHNGNEENNANVQADQSDPGRDISIKDDINTPLLDSLGTK